MSEQQQENDDEEGLVVEHHFENDCGVESSISFTVSVQNITHYPWDASASNQANSSLSLAATCRLAGCCLSTPLALLLLIALNKMPIAHPLSVSQKRCSFSFFHSFFLT
jgi:hypothetical protein